LLKKTPLPLRRGLTPNLANRQEVSPNKGTLLLLPPPQLVVLVVLLLLLRQSRVVARDLAAVKSKNHFGTTIILVAQAIIQIKPQKILDSNRFASISEFAVDTIPSRKIA
jgi:hypothetical protein